MTQMIKNPVIAIFGAGLVGCYVGGMLAGKGNDVRFLGRKKSGDTIMKDGMELSSYDGVSQKIDGDLIKWFHQVEDLSEADLVLVCVKSVDTLTAAKTIEQNCKPDATIVSLQNGVGNAEVLRQNTKENKVLAAMVGFNIIRIDDQQPWFHRGTEGEIIIENDNNGRYLVDRLNDAGIAASTESDMQSVLWGKLLLNLNNAVNVLSDLPLKRQLENRYYRRMLALSIEEALKVIKSAGIRPAKIGKVSPELIPFLLRLPNFIFRTVAGSMLKIDEEARSSMWDDFTAGRRSEIDFLNGSICKLGNEMKIQTPVNDKLVELVNMKFAGEARQFSSAKQMHETFLD